MKAEPTIETLTLREAKKHCSAEEFEQLNWLQNLVALEYGQPYDELDNMTLSGFQTALDVMGVLKD